jgi:predicted site-specific integrase-resolvase
VGECVSLVLCRAVAGTGAEGGAADSGGRPVGASRATLTNCGVCAVSSADQKADLDGQVARVTGWATTQQIPVDEVVTEVGSALNGHRREFLALLGDPAVTRVVVEHRDRLGRFGSGYVQGALVAQGRGLVVVDSAEVDDDLVRDMSEILTSMCAGVYGKRAVQNRARRAITAAAADDCEAA